MAVLTEAALNNVFVMGSSSPLGELSTLEEAAARALKTRCPSSNVARKYFKAIDALIDLEKALDQVPKSASQPRPKPRHSLDLALVPVVDTAPVDFSGPATHEPSRPVPRKSRTCASHTWC